MSKYLEPIILYEGPNTLKDLEKLKKDQRIWELRDVYEAQLKELFEIQNPPLLGTADYDKKLSLFLKERAGEGSGNWVYFPWSGMLIHMLGSSEYNALRTNRNKNLITAAEQETLSQFTIGVVGMSIGNAMAVSLAATGIAHNLKLADFDTLETTNLNRIRAGVHYLGIPKIDLTAQQIYEINPYAHLTLFSNGLKEKDLDTYITADPKPKLLFEAIDDFEMKIRIRMAARSAGIGVIMLTNLGDSVLIDVERYDLDKNTPLFNGLIGDIGDEILKGPISNKDASRYAVEIVGRENIPKRAMESLPEIGRTLVGRPQLMSTVTISGGIAAYLARRVALGEKLASGRRLIKLSEAIPQ